MAKPKIGSVVPTMAEIRKIPNRFTCVSTFSGGGGSCTGHRMAGAKILFASEFIPSAVETYRSNYPTTHLDTKDIRTLKVAEILKIAGLKKGELDLFDSSPPCSSYSTAGARDKGWNKEKMYSDNVWQRTDDLFQEFIRLLKGLAPKTFVVENVPGLAAGKAKGVMLEILESMESCGYKVSARILDASKLGVPQARRRIIFVGVRNDLVKLGFEPCHPTPLKSKPIAVKDVLPHVAYFKDKVTGGMLSYTPADRPSRTIVASDGTTSETAAFSTGLFVETVDGERRKMTTDEVKALCSFPSDYILAGKYEQQIERMGRAVPPLMMKAVTETLYKKVIKPYNDMQKGKK